MNGRSEAGERAARKGGRLGTAATVTTAEGESVSANTVSMIEKGNTALTVPIREIENNAEGIALGFRQNMLDIGDGSVAVGAGCGTDWIELTWGDRSCVLRGSEILRCWVGTFSPEDASRFPDEIREVAQP